MELGNALSISASGLDAQRIRMNVIASNLANISSTRTPSGGPYRKRDVVFSSAPPDGTFKGIFSLEMGEDGSGVDVVSIVEDMRPFKKVFDPTHPDADETGYLQLPNVNTMEEMVNMISASRSYEANITALNTTKNMALKALEIGR